MALKDKKEELMGKNIIKSDKKSGKTLKRKVIESVPADGEKKTKVETNKNFSVPKGITLIKSFIPVAYPAEYTIQFYPKLPKKPKQIDIIEAFNQYGHITFIQNFREKVVVAFLKEEEATSALHAHNITIGNSIVKVKKCTKYHIKSKNDSRKVLVYVIDPLVTEDDIRNHFKECGKILLINMKEKANNICFKIVFEDEKSGQAAIKLNNSILKDKNIKVRLEDVPFVSWYPHRTIILKNEDNLTKLEVSILTEIFEKFGEIENCNITCDAKKLAVITFKNGESAANALKLNGKHIKGINISVELYATQLLRNAVPHQPNPFSEKLQQARTKKRKVTVENMRKGTTCDDLKEFLESCGSIQDITFLTENKAIVEFSDSNGYCKSFALDNTACLGRRVSICPFSETKNEETEINNSK